MDASIARDRVAGEAAGHEEAEEALFAGARAHAEAMIAWAGSEQSLALEHEQLEKQAMDAGFEFMRLLAQAHLDLRAAREQRRGNVTDAGGDARRPATAKAAAARAKQAAASGWPDDPGELRKSRKRMAELAAVADIPPAPRTPGDILGALFGPAGQDGPAHPGPKAQGKTMFASVRKPAGEVIADAFADAHHRDPDHLRPWFAVVDGNNHQIETITALATDYQVTVPILIDLIHVAGLSTGPDAP